MLKVYSRRLILSFNIISLQAGDKPSSLPKINTKALLSTAKSVKMSTGITRIDDSKESSSIEDAFKRITIAAAAPATTKHPVPPTPASSPVSCDGDRESESTTPAVQLSKRNRR